MPRRMLRPLDSVRTDLLAIDELFVVRGQGDNNNYVAWRYEYEEKPVCCPICSGKEIKAHDKFSRTYMDYIMEGNVPKIINLKYEFYKYRCKNPVCGRVFQAEISFATINDHVTHRLEDKIAELVIGGSSYEEISSNTFGGQLTRQAVGQIFVRWVHMRNDRRSLIYLPTVIGAITGRTDDNTYILIVSCDDGIRVLDVLLGMDSAKVIASLRRFGSKASRCILTDCDPTIYAAVKEALPDVLHIIPAEMWLKLVREDFSLLSHDIMRWAVPSIKNKRDLVLAPKVADEQNTSIELQRIFSARSELKEPYKDYHYLRDLIMNRGFRWDISELDAWPDDLDSTFRERLGATLLQYNLYREEIARHQEHPEFVPDNLLTATDRLEELISTRRNFSEEALQAAILYSVDSDLDHWQGIRIEEIIIKLSRLQKSSRRSDYDDE